jgi:cytochrome c biogenesis protein CcmG, thiol:disulfide interchange protein DsbE
MRHAVSQSATLHAVRRAVIAICALALTAAIVAGVLQARDRAGGGSDGAAAHETTEPLSLAQVSAPVDGAPPPLAALRERVNELVPGGPKAFDAQLRALRGHPVVVNMWASWCDPCQFELPFLQREAVRRAAEVAFLGINVADARSAAQRMAARYPMPYPSFEDPRDALFRRYGARGLPATAFYDARGKLAFVHQGVFSTQAKLAEAIDRYAAARG